jgi:hypothetical protein
VVIRVWSAEFLAGWGSGMGCVLHLVEIEANGSGRSVDVMAIDFSGDLSNIADRGFNGLMLHFR